MNPIRVVQTELELRLVVPGGPPLPVLVNVRYQVDDPWAIRVTFEAGEDEVVEWMFARQLLAEGIRQTVGAGDVRVWPSTTDGEHVVNLAMTSPSGAALFEIDRDALLEFLQHTYLAVPTDSEEDVVDIDAELALLLAE